MRQMSDSKQNTTIVMIACMLEMPRANTYRRMVNYTAPHEANHVHATENYENRGANKNPIQMEASEDERKKLDELFSQMFTLTLDCSNPRSVVKSWTFLNTERDVPADLRTYCDWCPTGNVEPASGVFSRRVTSCAAKTSCTT